MNFKLWIEEKWFGQYTSEDAIRLKNLNAWEMTKEDFQLSFGIHSTENPNAEIDPKKTMELTRPGFKRFFNRPIIVVRNITGWVIPGEHYVCALDGHKISVVTRDQKEAALYEKGYEAVVAAHHAKGIHEV